MKIHRIQTFRFFPAQKTGILKNCKTGMCRSLTTLLLESRFEIQHEDIGERCKNVVQ